MPDSCNPIDCSLPISSVHGIPGKNTGMGCQLPLPKKVSVKEINPLYIDIWPAGDQPRLIQGIRRRDGIGEDQDTIASIRY